MTDKVREFVIAAHRDLEAVKALYADHPDLIDEPIEWGPGQTETPLQAAAHTGQRSIAEFLLDNGATPNMVAYAMLGDEAQFKAMLADDPDHINEIGAHNFSLMFHAAIGGNLTIIQTIAEKADNSDLAIAVHAAMMGNQKEAVEWFVEQGAPLDSTDFRGRTPLDTAVENEDDALIALFKSAMDDDQLPTCDNCGEKGTRYLAELDGNPMGAHTKIFKCKNCDHTMATVEAGT